MPEWYQAHKLSTSDRDFVSSQYLTSQLIAYIGNKRRMLGFLYRIFSQLNERHPISRFIDPFAGSGSVSRLARQMGFEVAANDWEEYSRVINRAYLTNRPCDLDPLFEKRGGIRAVLDTLNTLDNGPAHPYISAYYAPLRTEAANYRTERLFYTRENALFIDRVRERIEEWYPPGDPDSGKSRARDLLLSLLLYEAATHVNTSGVFKAYHKGFGGHGGDALKRIMSSMQLEFPVLHPSTAAAEVEQLDAARFLEARSGDLCYLDPPYTIHQYGSNYHMLNTIARWDFPQVDNRLGPDGRLRRKAGIRSDWVQTRSDFCYARTAPGALEEVLQATDARFVVLSYNSDGVIPMGELLEILSGHGKVEINSLEYITYRGGRQSIRRQIHNTEFQIVVERTACRGKGKSLGGGAEAADMERLLTALKIQSLLQGSFVPQRLLHTFPAPALGGNGDQGGKDERSDDSRIHLFSGGKGQGLKTEKFYRFLETPSIPRLQELSLSELERIGAGLEEAACSTRQEELQVLLAILEDCTDERSQDMYQRRILHVLKKFTHRKYIDQWREEMKRLEDYVCRKDGQVKVLREGLSELAELARRRFEG